MTQRLAVCAIFKNEAPYLLEWIAYHRVVGFDHFFLYDNDSTDGGADLIRRSTLGEHVTITQWPERPGQLLAYHDFITRQARDWDWVAFIDLDEFIHPLDDETVRPLLSRLDGFSCLMLHWRTFGPSGWEVRPPGLAIDNYVLRFPDDADNNRHVKTVARGSDLVDVMTNPHHFALTGHLCNALGEQVPNAPMLPPCHDVMVINHYQTRSRQDWSEKLARGSALLWLAGPRFSFDVITHFEETSTVEDHAIKRFIPPVCRLLEPAPRLLESIDKFFYLRLLEPALLGFDVPARQALLQRYAAGFDRMEAPDRAIAIDAAFAALDAVLARLWAKASGNDITAEEARCLRRGLTAVALARHPPDRVKPFPGWDTP